MSDFMKTRNIVDIMTMVRLEIIMSDKWVVEPCAALEPVLVSGDDVKKIWGDKKPTMATNHKQLFYTEEFVRSIPFEQNVGVHVHEGLHRALGHCLRLRGADPNRAGVAADVIVNRYTVDMGYKLPPDALFIENLVEHINVPKGVNPKDIPYKYSMEEIYMMFKPSSDGKIKQPSWGYIMEPTGADGKELTQSELDVEAHDAKLEMMGAIERAERSKPGSTPGGVKDMIAEMLRPKVDWRHVLNDWLIGSKPAKLSYQRLNKRYRRFAPLPSMRKREFGTLVIFKDTSGSVSDREQKQFLAEMNLISTMANFERIITVPVDYNVHEDGIQTFLPGQPIRTSNLHGRGGTTFVNAFKWLEKRKDIKPFKIIYMSDLEGEFPKKPYPVPTLWVSTTRIVAPWGKTIHIEGVR